MADGVRWRQYAHCGARLVSLSGADWQSACGQQLRCDCLPEGNRV